MYGEHLNQDAEIRIFTENDCEACQAIWLACFPEDTPEAPEHFFRDVLHRGEGLVYQTGGRPVSMVFMLPAELVGEDGRLPIQYIYAAATHPDYQHRGIFAALLRGALDRAAKPGNGGIVPASGRAGPDRLLCRIRLPAVFYRLAPRSDGGDRRKDSRWKMEIRFC